MPLKAAARPEVPQNEQNASTQCGVMCIIPQDTFTTLHVLHQDLKRAPLTPLETLRTASGTPIDHRYQHFGDHRRNIDRIQQEQYNSEGNRTSNALEEMWLQKGIKNVSCKTR